jgi:hypothetical protein
MNHALRREKFTEDDVTIYIGEMILALCCLLSGANS